MRLFVVKPKCRFRGKISFPGDKSIAHRALILSALAKSTTRIENFPASKDCLLTAEVFRKLGIKITLKALNKGRTCSLTVSGKGLSGFKKPAGPIFVGESGTTLRLILGVLAGQHFTTRLIAASSLSKRPMLRVTKPLRLMGARISSQGAKGAQEYPPITISGGSLEPVTYKLPVASAQVKSAILLAGLYARGATKVIEPVSTRDHTERMLKLFKAGIKVKANTIVIKGGRPPVSPKKIFIPGDISSAAFFIVLSAITPGSRIKIERVGLNPSRTGLLRVLKRMGADIRIIRYPAGRQAALGLCEPTGDLIVKSSRLKGVRIKPGEVPSVIDELPILMVAAGTSRGKSVFEGVGELRVKETDRIKSMVYNLRRMGADITVSNTGPLEKIFIRGVSGLKGAQLKSFGDHRTAMSMVVAACSADGKSSIDDISCIQKSFPDFITLLNALKG